MTPVLIDTRSWLKFGFITVFLSSTIFATGFFFGYQKATVHNQIDSEQTDSKVVALLLPEENADTNISVEPVVPGVIEEGEDIDVDQAENSKASASVEDGAELDIAELKMAELKSTSQKDLASDESMSVTKEIPVVQTAAKESVLNSPNDTSLILDEMDNIKYSIQVGVYGRLSSAEKVATELKAENFDVYITEYINKSNKVRYNVRLGYFVDKKASLPTLSRFRREQRSDAYVVKFSADAIIEIVNEESI